MFAIATMELVVEEAVRLIRSSSSRPAGPAYTKGGSLGTGVRTIDRGSPSGPAGEPTPSPSFVMKYGTDVLATATRNTIRSDCPEEG
jgi:hypothetical protein